MENLKSFIKLATFMVVLAFTMPAMMGCSENPISSGSDNLPNEAIQPNDPGVTGGTIDTSGSSQPGDSVDPGQPSVLESAYMPAQIRVLQRDSNILNSLFNLLHSVVRTISSLLGGVVSLLDVTLQIPPLALDSNTPISIEIPDLNYYVYDFGPDGLQFNKPATIIISYRYANLNGVDESKIRLAWWNESAGEWSIMPCVVNTTKNTVTGQVYHFSSYGLISD